MLQSTYAVQQREALEERGPDLAHYFLLARRRLFYFLIPFSIILIAGLLVVAIQRPIYFAEGKILVESQDIPTDLVRPTITDSANQRIQVIQQRIMTRDNLLPIVTKYGLFASQRRWMSGSELLDLMRERTTLDLVDLNSLIAEENNKKKKGSQTVARPMLPQQNNSTIALTLGFEYENAEIAMRVANEFLTLVLSEDARTRANRAAETTKFLAREVKRLEGELGAIDAQIAELRKTAVHRTLPTMDPAAAQLATLKADLAQKMSIYSPAHPDVKALKRKIEIFEKSIEKPPQQLAAAIPDQQIAGLDELLKQRESSQKNVDDAVRKLAAARLGENLEKDQQSERLQVIEQPALPQTPIRPNRVKLGAMVFAAAMAFGLGLAFLAEMLDKSIHGTYELAGFVDKDLIVSIPYITTAEEISRKRRRRLAIWAALAGVTVVVLSAAYFFGLPLDPYALSDRMSGDTFQAWFDALRRIGK
jgi:uncharacterized protein involved in exopolysaccharide biosynthesis